MGPHILRPRHLCAATMPLLLFIATGAAAQGPGAGASAAQPLIGPLSGRTTQPGAVVAAQTPVPGPTTGVNTLNPVIEVQGSFRGSTLRGARPFSGALSLRDAVQRAETAQQPLRGDHHRLAGGAAAEQAGQ